MGMAIVNEESFNNWRSENEKAIQSVIIPKDINPAIAIGVLSDLDRLYSFVRLELAEIESFKDRAESIIREGERSKAIGKNDDERKRVAAEFLQSYPHGANDTFINMYEQSRIMTYRYHIVKGMVDVIFAKQQRLITLSGLFKIDKDIGYGG